MTDRRDFLTTLGAAALAGSLPGLSHAQSGAWPTAKPISYIVPFFPGSTADVVARVVAQKVGDAIKQSIIVDNRTGVGGNIGVAAGAKAAPDGYTLIGGTSGTHATNVSLYKNLPYDPVKDFEPVSLIGSQTSILVVGTTLGVNSVAELIALLRKDPSKRVYGSAGAGTSPHLAGELFSDLIDVPLTHVPYKGNPPAIVDVASGQLAFMFNQMTTAGPLLKTGKVKALAVTTAKRSALAPHLPTMIESGVPGFEIVSWHAVYAPRGTPQPIVQRLHDEIVKALQAPDVKDKLVNGIGLEIVGGTPTELADLMAREIPRWAALVKKSGATPD